MDFKHYLKINAKTLLTHVCAQLIALVVWLFAFVYLSSLSWGKVFVCVFLCCFYAVYMYSCAYKIGEKDTKSYSEHKPYPLKGLTLGIFIVLIGLIFIFIYNIGLGYKNSHYNAYVWCLNLFSVWNFNVSNLIFYPYNMGAWFYVLSFGITIVSLFLGYLAGMYRFEAGYKILSKIVYKKSK